MDARRIFTAWKVCLLLCAWLTLVSPYTLWPYFSGIGGSASNKGPAALQTADGTFNLDLTTLGDGLGINFLGTKYTQLHVSTNGVVEFGPGGGASSMSRPDPALSVGDPSYGPYIAPLWEHADAPGTSTPSTGTIRLFLSDASTDPGDIIGLRRTLTTLVTDQYFANAAQKYTSTSLAIMVTWNRIYSNGHTLDQKNSYQLIILTDGCQTYIVLNYNQIQWTEAATDGTKKPLAAVSAGDGVTWLELPDSRTDALVNLVSESNVHDPSRTTGWFGLRVDRVAVMELCPAACETQGFGTCGTYGCACFDSGIASRVDCSDAIYTDMIQVEPLTACATPCGGCSRWTVRITPDDCSGLSSTRVEDCNVSPCVKGVHPKAQLLYRRGRRIRRNRKCCYTFEGQNSIKISKAVFPVGKSCCRQRVGGWNGPSPLYTC